MDEKLKKDSTELFEDLGMDFDTAIRVFLTQAVREQKIPFKIKTDISYVDDEELFDLSDKIISDNMECYKELSK